MNTLRNIERLYRVIDRSLFYTDGNLDYARLTDAFISLSNAIMADDSDTETIWSIGEYSSVSLDNLIVGAYWHFTEWHDGQASTSYAALCALGEVFQPGMSSVEPDDLTYEQLNAIAQKGL